MKFIQFLHMPKLSPSPKLQLSQIIYVSPASIFIFCPDWHIAKQVLSIPLLLPSNFLVNLPYPNHFHMIIFSSIFLVNLSQEISKVSTSREALWSKYYLGLPKWSENLPRHNLTYVTYLHQIWDHFIHPISLTSFPKFLSIEEHCEGSTIFYICKWHEIYTVPSYSQIITLLQIAAQ